MQHITVDDSQAKIISEATGWVEVRDQHGKALGYVAAGFSAEDIAIAKRRLASQEPRYSTQQVLDYVQTLESK
jgi:hypothetical protein